MKKVWLIGSALVLLLVLLVTGCGPKAPEQEIVTLEFFTASPTFATPYQVALAITEMLHGKHPWLRGATPVPGMGAATAIQASEPLPPERKNLSFISGPATPTFPQLKAGVEPYTRKYPDIKLVMTIRQGTWTFVTYNPEIKTGQDLIGKKVALHPGPQDPNYLGIAILRDAWGVWDKIIPSHHSVAGHKDLLVTGIVDASFATSINQAAGGKWMVTAQVPPIVSAKQSYWMNVTEEDVGKVNAANIWKTWLVRMPKDAAGKDMPPEDTGMVGWTVMMTCWDSVDEGIVYELVKFVAENPADWEAYTQNPGGAEFLGAFGPGITEADVHPGALRYYKEKGVKIGG